MISPGAMLRRLQDEEYFRLKSEAIFRDLPIFRERAGEISDEQIKVMLGALNKGDTGKVGVCLIVLAARLAKTEKNPVGPKFDVQLTIQAVVNPPVAEDTANNGVGMYADEIALAALHLFHQYKAGGLAGLILPDEKNAIEPVDELMKAGLDAFNVTMILPWGLSGGDLCAAPSISGNAAAITLTTTTAGAAIYYTTDGTYPGSGNPAATLYAVPFAVTIGDMVRASAEHDDLVPSDVSFRTISS